MSTIELAQALHALVGELDAAADELLRTEFDVTHSQLAFLMPLLRDGELDVSSLAARNGVSSAAISKRVEWFVARDLIDATHPPGDAKRVVLALTTRGRRLASAASGRLAARLDEVLAAWPRARRALLAELAQEATAAVKAGRAGAMGEST